jgi:hypothetical protein
MLKYAQLRTKLATSADVEIFSREVKNIKHDRYFHQDLERSNPHKHYPHTRIHTYEDTYIRGG